MNSKFFKAYSQLKDEGKASASKPIIKSKDRVCTVDNGASSHMTEFSSLSPRDKKTTRKNTQLLGNTICQRHRSFYNRSEFVHPGVCKGEQCDRTKSWVKRAISLHELFTEEIMHDDTVWVRQSLPAETDAKPRPVIKTKSPLEETDAGRRGSGHGEEGKRSREKGSQLFQNKWR